MIPPQFIIAGAMFAALTATIGMQQVRVSALKTDLATEKSARAVETQQRTQTALDHSEVMRLKERQHTADTQQKVDAYESYIVVLKTDADRSRAIAQRVRHDLSSYTSGAAQPGEADAVACQRAQDRLPRVGSLLGEGISLEAESRELIRQRDAEIVLLVGQIAADRAACSPK